MVELVKMTTAEQVIEMMITERDIVRKVIAATEEYVKSEKVSLGDSMMHAAMIGRETTLDQMISEANGIEWAGSDAN